MLSLYQASVNYIVAEQKVLGANHDKLSSSQDARVQHFVSTVSALPQDVADCAATQNALQMETAAFSADHRHTMARAVAAHMQQETTESSKLGNKTQSNKYIYNYLPECKWCFIMDKEKSWTDKKEAIIDWCIEALGLRNPNVETVKIILGILAEAHNRKFEPNEAYRELHAMTDTWVNKRELMPGKQKMRSYPSDASDFQKLHPESYLQCEPPIPSRIDPNKLRQVTRKDRMPARSSNKYVDKSSPASSSNSGQGDLTQQMAMMALQWVMNGRGNSPPLPSPEKTRPKKKGPAAIEDGSPGDDNEEDLSPEPPQKKAILDRQRTMDADRLKAKGGATADDDDDVQKTIDQARATLANKKARVDKAKKVKSAAKQDAKGKAVKKKPAAATSSVDKSIIDDGTNIDDELEFSESNSGSEEVDETPIVKAKPAAAIKKKPAAFVVPPNAKRPKPSLEPTMYHGGRIYYSPKKFAFRVYRRRVDRVEKCITARGVEDKKVLQQAWDTVCYEIESDPRPVVE